MNPNSANHLEQHIETSIQLYVQFFVPLLFIIYFFLRVYFLFVDFINKIYQTMNSIMDGTGNEYKRSEQLGQQPNSNNIA